MRSGGEPGEKSRLGGRQIDAGDADLGKSELSRPPPQLRQQLRAIQRLSSDDDRHAPILGSRAATWRDEAQCALAAQALAANPALRDAVVELSGPLGAGKTTFVRHLLRALGATGRIRSPTFAVMEPYELPALHAWHFDFYRFDDPREWADAGFRDVFAADGLKLAEWPEKAQRALPAPDLRLFVEVDSDDSRSVRAEACTPLGLELL